MRKGIARSKGMLLRNIYAKSRNKNFKEEYQGAEDKSRVDIAFEGKKHLIVNRS